MTRSEVPPIESDVDPSDEPSTIEGLERRFSYNLKRRLEGEGADLYVDLNAIKLDWWDVHEQTDIARMHMFTSATRDVPLATRLQRVETWAQTIGIYDELMVPDERRIYQLEELEALLAANQLPRPSTIELAGGSRGLRQLYEELGLELNGQEDRRGEFKTTWTKLHELAVGGEFVDTWKRIRGLDS